MKFYIIYETVNKINGQSYIGKHITDNPNDSYLGSGKYLKRAINKYGIENFEKRVLHIFDNKEDMDKKEAELVDEAYLKFCKTYNLKQGGQGGWDYVNEKRTKQSRVVFGKMGYIKVIENIGLEKWKEICKSNGKNNKCKKRTEETKRLLSLMRLGHPLSIEHKRKIGEKNSIHQQGVKNSQYGTCWIYNDKESIKIKKENLDEHLSQGWLKGRKINF